MPTHDEAIKPTSSKDILPDVPGTTMDEPAQELV